MRRLLGDEFAVNSFHHQAVADAGPSLTATAWAKDGVIEVVENETGSIVGVQWHPEILGTNPELFDAFVGAAAVYASRSSK